MNCLYTCSAAARHRYVWLFRKLFYRKIIFLWMLCCWGSNQLLAQERSANISIELRQVSLRQALTLVEARSGIRIAFNSRLAELDKTIDTSFSNAPLQEVLQALLKGTSLVIKKAQRYYFITSRNGVPGGLSGRIADIETTDPLANASVIIKELNKGTVTDDNGYYFFETLPPGKYTLELSFAGYKKFTATGIDIQQDAVNQYDGLLQAENRLQSVTVTASGRFGRVSNTTDAQLVNEIRNSRNIISGISNEQIQKSTDRDAGEIAKRITGVSVAENFAIIRGLNRRYNITFLNDLIAPATEQDSRAFSLDLINSSLIDKMVVYKSPVPELPGDFVGGALKISTKNAMLVRQLDVQVSASYRPQSSFNDFYTYKGSNTDWLGFDNGSRKLPAGFPDIVKMSLAGVKEKAEYGRMLSNNWQYVTAHHDLDKRFVLNYYDSWKLGKYSRLSNLTSVTYTHTVTTNEIERQFGRSESYLVHNNGKPYERKFGQFTNSSDIQSQNSHRIGILQNFSLTLKDSSRIDFRNFFNQLGNDLVNVSVLTNAEFLDQEQKNVQLYYRQRRLYTGQLSGTHYLFTKKNPLKWSLGFASTNQQEPDMRTLNYTRYWNKDIAAFEENNASPWTLSLSDGNQYTAFNRRLFTTTTETGYTGSADYEHKLSNGIVVKLGTYNEFKEREFSSREMEVVTGTGYFDQRITSIGSSNIDELYHPNKYRDDGSGFELQHFIGTRYTASNQWNSGYVGIVAPLFRQRLNIYAGTRYDHYRFRMAAEGRSGISVVYPIEVDNPDNFILPSINASWNFSNNMVVRTAFARSINRPEFRELAPFAYFNNTTQIQEWGNPDLKTATFSNYDLRWEWYLQGNKHNEMLSMGFFYKKGQDLIEAFTINDINSQGGNQLLFKNSKEADFYGVELEVRKNLDFFSSRILRRFSVILNGSWIKTEVFTPGTDGTGAFDLGNSNRTDRTRPLQGQSPWLVNAILNYDNVRWGSRLSLSYNYSADRISVVGNNDLAGDGIPNPDGSDAESGFPDIMEKGRGVLDFSILQRINKWLQVRFSVQDLLNKPVLFYEDRNRNYKYNAEVMESDATGNFKTGRGDNMFMRYKPYSYYTLSFNFSFY